MTKIKAFSLIELLTVVAIISILATISISSYTAAVKKGRDAKQKSDIHNIQQALLLYRADMGAYPAALSSLVPNYIRVVPVNAVATSGNYQYNPLNSNKQFTICTGVLESPRNSANSTVNNPAANFTPCVNTNGLNTAGNCRFYCVANP